MGRSDPPLSALGRDQAAAFRDPSPARVFSSPARRALETAALRYPSAEIVVLREAAELDFGWLEGLTPDAALRRFPEFFQGFREGRLDYSSVRGESWLALEERAHRVALVLAQEREAVLVAHQLFLASLLRILGCEARHLGHNEGIRVVVSAEGG